MKKILILLFNLIIFNLSFSTELYLKGIDSEKIKKILINEGFKFEYVDKDYSFFEKMKGESEQRVDVYFMHEKIYGIGITSSHFHSTPNQKIIKAELENMVEKISLGIENNIIKAELVKAIKKITINSPNENLKSSGKYLEQNINTHKVGSYIIDIFDTAEEKSIEISCD